MIEFDSSSDAYVDMSAYIQAINGVEVEALIEQSDGFGASWVAQAYAGVRKMNDIQLDGFYERHRHDWAGCHVQ